MNVRAPLAFGFILAGAALLAAACGSSSNSGNTTGSTTSGTTTGSTTTTGSGGAGGSSGADCKQVCTDVYNCGLQKDANMMQLCPGFKGGAELDTWLNGKMMDGCIATCMSQPALAAVVDKSNCPKTISTLKSLSSDKFKPTCEMGLSGGAGGAGGGTTGTTTGAGGAGGAK